MQRSTLILPPLPTQEFDRMAREAWEYTQRHYRETGYLPKEELYLRADPVIGKAMWAEDQRAWEEAQERIKARATRLAIVIALNTIARQYAIQLAKVWGTTWSREVIRQQLEGCYKQFTKNGNKNLLKGNDVAGRKLFEDLVDTINDPRVSPRRTYEIFLDFLARHMNPQQPDRNLINRIAECIAAKALWFSVLIYLRPGPRGG